jgi:hypothetical protein
MSRMLYLENIFQHPEHWQLIRKGYPLQAASHRNIIHLYYRSKTDNYFWWGIGIHFQSEGCCCLATMIGDGAGHKLFLEELNLFIEVKG